MCGTVSGSGGLRFMFNFYLQLLFCVFHNFARRMRQDVDGEDDGFKSRRPTTLRPARGRSVKVVRGGREESCPGSGEIMLL